MFPVVPFNKITLFSKDLTTFIITFASFFLSVILELVDDESSLLSFSNSGPAINVLIFNFLI